MNRKSKVKRICMITMSSYPEDTRILRQVIALESAGYEVDILCRTYQNQSKVEKFNSTTAYRIMNAPPREGAMAYVLQSLIFMLIVLFRLQVLAIKRKYILIQTHNLPDYLVFASAIQKLFGIKLILDIHDPSVELYKTKWPGKKSSSIIKLVGLIERLSCHFADHLITVTNECKKRLVSRGNRDDKIAIIMNTADEGTFKFSNERKFLRISEKVKILYHGTVAERFGLYNAIGAMTHIIAEFPGSVFSIYGRYEDSYRKKIEELIKKLKLENNVFLHGKVSIDKVPDLIKSHDVGIVPYLSTDFMNLALPTKAFEYVAVGMPVVSTRLSEMSQIFDEQCVTYFDQSDPEKIAEAIKYVCLNPEIIEQKVITAYDKLSLISGQEMMKKYLTLIEQLTLDKEDSLSS